MSPTLTRSLFAEFLGTALLVFLGVGSAVAGIDRLGPVGVALAFGLTLLALAYAVGPVSGCHINPAVTLGVLLSRGMTTAEAVYYWLAQLAGGIAGAAVLKLLVSGFGKVKDQTGTLGTNNWGTTISMGGAFVLEVLLTFVLVAVVLLVTGRAAAPGFAGLAIGLTLSAVHLVGVPLDGTSVNPARSFGPALFEGGDALAHVWLFFVAPLIGAAVAAAVVQVVRAPVLTEEAEREELAEAPEPAVDETGAQLPSLPPARSPEASETRTRQPRTPG
ncbi:MAG TPA: aquaporin [Blastococcus sp.]|nr:aquaporin [Blastococcus sp.]